MKLRKGRSNVEKLFALREIPKDNQIRNLLAPVLPGHLNRCYRRIFQALEETDILERRRSFANQVLVAIDVALELGASPHAFVLATVIGASTSFLTPVGHQANVLVFGPGGYRFLDYTRVGWLLNIVILVVTLIFLPILWPLFP